MELSWDAQTFLEKNREKKIVFTNGCFDLLHRGHIVYLNEAKKLGDVLIVGLNSDLSVRKLKGKERPFNTEKDRKFLLENLKVVDFVEIFPEGDPLRLIKQIRPDVLAKGGDWKLQDIVGYKEVISFGGEVRSLSLIDSYSSSGLIEKIRGM